MLTMASPSCGITQKALPSSSPPLIDVLAFDRQRSTCRPVSALTRDGRAISCTQPAGNTAFAAMLPSVASRPSDAQHVARRRAPAAMRRRHAGAPVELQLGATRAHRAPQALVEKGFVRQAVARSRITAASCTLAGDTL